MQNRLLDTLARIARLLDSLGYTWALVGGMAVSIRVEPRTTRDVDLAVAVTDDTEAEALIPQLVARGYRIFGQLEHSDTERLAGMRLIAPTEQEQGLVVDLLFASSGIEREVAEGSEALEISPGLVVPIAQIGDLIALKILSGKSDRTGYRGHDIRDLRWLMESATPADIERARSSLALITARGFDRGTDIRSSLNELLEASPPRLE